MSIIKDKQKRQYVQHHLRTHLTIIKGNAEMLDLYYSDNDVKEKQMLAQTKTYKRYRKFSGRIIEFYVIDQEDVSA